MKPDGFGGRVGRRHREALHNASRSCRPYLVRASSASATVLACPLPTRRLRSASITSAYQLYSLGEVEPPGPAPRRRANHAKRSAMRALDRIRQIAVERHKARPEVPDERPGA